MRSSWGNWGFSARGDSRETTGVCPWLWGDSIPQSFQGCLTLQDCLPRNSVNQAHKQLKFALSKVSDLLTKISYLLFPKQPPHHPSLFPNNMSSGASPLTPSLAGSFLPRSQGSSWTASSLLHFYIFIRWIPWEQRLAILRRLSAVYSIVHLSIHPMWVVYNRLTPGCLPWWPSPDS